MKVSHKKRTTVRFIVWGKWKWRVIEIGEITTQIFRWRKTCWDDFCPFEYYESVEVRMTMRIKYTVVMMMLNLRQDALVSVRCFQLSAYQLPWSFISTKRQILNTWTSCRCSSSIYIRMHFPNNSRICYIKSMTSDRWLSSCFDGYALKLYTLQLQWIYSESGHQLISFSIVSSCSC